MRFTSEQAEYLKRMFELDPRPTTAAKDNMARKLGLPLRSVINRVCKSFETIKFGHI